MKAWVNMLNYNLKRVLEEASLCKMANAYYFKNMAKQFYHMIEIYITLIQIYILGRIPF